MIKWKQIEEAPDYWISNRGEVLSRRTTIEKILTTHLNKVTGYYQITLSTHPKPNREKKTFYIHHLVAKYFVENPTDYDRINHKNLDKSNNHFWNLEWVSQEMNIHHYYHSDAKDKPRNMREVEVWSKDGNYITTYPSISSAARNLKMQPSSIHQQCKMGGAKNPRTYLFKYKSQTEC